MHNVLSTITVHINKYELFYDFTLSEYCIPPILMSEYIAKTIYLQLRLSPLFVNSLATLIEINS